MKIPVSRVTDKVSLKPSCTSPEASQMLRLSDLDTREIILSFLFREKQKVTDQPVW